MAQLVGLLNLTSIQVKLTMDVTSLLDLTTECLHFLTGSSEVTSKSASNACHNELLVAPQSSIIWKLYSQGVQPIVRRVVVGIL